MWMTSGTIQTHDITNQKARFKWISRGQRVEISHQQVRLALLTGWGHDPQDLAYLPFTKAISRPATIKCSIQVGYKHYKLLAAALLHTYFQYWLIEYARISMNLAIYN